MIQKSLSSNSKPDHGSPHRLYISLDFIELNRGFAEQQHFTVNRVFQCSPAILHFFFLYIKLSKALKYS